MIVEISCGKGDLISFSYYQLYIYFTPIFGCCLLIFIVRVVLNIYINVVVNLTHQLIYVCV